MIQCAVLFICHKNRDLFRLWTLVNFHGEIKSITSHIILECLFHNEVSVVQWTKALEVVS